jgi:hypothetical protein
VGGSGDNFCYSVALAIIRDQSDGTSPTIKPIEVIDEDGFTDGSSGSFCYGATLDIIKDRLL